jgi:uncharacterized SAM-binding protein YcdF (DUF218 family)
MPEAEQLGSLKPPSKSSRRWALWFLLLLLGFLFGMLRWGGYLLTASDPLPAHVDAAVVLQGSTVGETARLSGAMNLLQRGVADRILLSIPKESYWGEPMMPAVRNYIARNYDSERAANVDFCETGPDVNSTAQEAIAVNDCIRSHDWKSIMVVTSNYHTRRAGMIWRAVLRKQGSPVHLWIHGVPDPEFHPQGWWRERLSAKTWFLEVSKLIWAELFGWEESATSTVSTHGGQQLYLA